MLSISIYSKINSTFFFFFEYVQVQLKPFDPEFIALANDVFSINMPSHTYRSYTILPKPFNAVQDARVN